MSVLPINKTDSVQLLAVDSSNNGLTGLTITLSIKQDSNGYFWNGSSFQSGAITVTMSETDSINQPGVYDYQFDTAGLTENKYSYYATTSGGAVNKPWSGELNTAINPDDYKSDVTNLDVAISSRAIPNEYDSELAAIQADLNNPDQYKADISGVATQASIDALNDISTTDVAEIATDGASEGTLAGDVDIAKKMIANDLTKSGDTVGIKENNGVDSFRDYTVTTTERTKQ